MEHDYYQVLGIDPGAGPEAIRQAYRRLSRECHPDRGGSHERMVLLNEAWEVLSDPAARRRYDESRRAAAGEAAREAAAADARDARRRAEQYPRRWDEFERWLAGVAGDFSGAEHDSVPVYGEFRFPVVGRSCSGWLFILGGALLGGIFLSTAVADFCGRNKLKGLPALLLVAAPVLGGAWAGAFVHRWIAAEVRKAKEQSAGGARHRPSGGAAAGRAEPGGRVVACGGCGQKLRVPHSAADLVVTCRACGHRFDVQGEGAGPCPGCGSPTGWDGVRCPWCGFTA